MTVTRLRANALLTIAAVFWGLGNVAQITVLHHLGPFMAVALRCAIGFAVILPMLWSAPMASERGAKRSSIMHLFFAAVSFALAISVAQIGARFTTATNLGFLLNTTTIMTPLLSWFMLRQRPDPRVWPAALAVMFGAFLLSGGSISTVNVGDMLCVLAAAFYTVWIVSVGLYVQHGGSPVVLALTQFGLTALVNLVITLTIEVTNVSAIINAAPELLVMGVLATGVAFLLQGVAQTRTSSCEAAVIMSAEALFSTLGGFLWLDERLDQIQTIGAILIALGIMLVQLPPARHRRQVNQARTFSPSPAVSTRTLSSRGK
jgi:drug/metabolite transporter (DMT)-like permease